MNLQPHASIQGSALPGRPPGLSSWVHHALTVAAFLIAFAVPTYGWAQQPFSLDEAIELGLDKSFSVRGSALDIEAAEAERKTARAHYGPILKAEANVIVWDEEQFLSLGTGGVPQLPPPATPYEQVVAGLVEGLGQPTSIREQVTSQVKLTLAQPLSMLWTIHLAAKLADKNVEATRVSRSAAEQRVAVDVAIGYYRLLQTIAVNENHKLSIEQLEVQLERLDVLVRNGVVAESDLLKIKLAIAASKQEELKSRGNVELARSGLALTMGLAPNTAIVPTTRPEVGPTTSDVDLDAALRTALERRRELKELDVRIEQATDAKSLAKAAMIPDVTAIASYSHDEGSSLAAPNSYFGGLFLSWNVFEFGATYHGIGAAEARRQRVLLGREQLVMGIRFEVEKAHRDAAISAQALDVASMAEEVALDSFSIEEKRLAQGVSTTADLIDAEKALTQARNNKLLAYYEFLVAHASFVAATGAPISATSITPGR